ncbi:MAG: hypothetical protein ACRENG_33830 [bacterium]
MSKPRRKKYRTYAAIFAAQRRKRFRLYLLLGVGIIVFSGLTLWLNLSQTQQPPANWRDHLHPRALAIAAKFLCGCNPSCTMALSECPCSKHGGGLEEMYFISNLLNSGEDEVQVVQKVREKYGRLRP